jgi:hypothetical protein
MHVTGELTLALRREFFTAFSEKVWHFYVVQGHRFLMAALMLGFSLHPTAIQKMH